MWQDEQRPPPKNSVSPRAAIAGSRDGRLLDRAQVRDDPPDLLLGSLFGGIAVPGTPSVIVSDSPRPIRHGSTTPVVRSGPRMPPFAGHPVAEHAFLPEQHCAVP